MRFAAAALLAFTSLAPAAQAQDALGAPGVLRIGAVGQTRVVMVQGVAADPFVWEWSFLDEEVDQDGEVFDSLAISVMYDCDARTRRPLVLETYRDGAFVSQTPLYEEPAPVEANSLADGAMQVVCEPETNSDGAAFDTMVAARTVMDARNSPSVTPP
ncbi:MAG: hypothetical protein KKA16_08795 [Alphaproteobacteria bacterium]|nr:hypothetical protein [Alphaproteobacteria bacterium]MBU1539932.1 hypothetical protein [Alphaproteobacteria bacterium]MBU2380124.1 hypothetical protein [Alphaproteobacteria bacterium]